MIQTDANARIAPIWRCLLVWATATVVLGSLTLWLLPAAAALLHPSWHTRSFADLLGLACAPVAIVVAGWLWGSVTVVAVEAAAGTPLALGRHCPAGLRMLVLAACGSALAGSMLSPATAAGALAGSRPPGLAAGEASGGASGDADRSHLHGLRLPERPAGGGSSQPAPPRRATLVVRPGDSLWQLAAQSLPADAEAAVIAQRTRDLYRVNRAVIGDDPDLIQPGMTLRNPGDHPRRHP